MGFVAAVLSALIVASMFLSWVDLGPIYTASLWQLFVEYFGNLRRALFEGSAAWGLWTFVLSFPMAVIGTLANMGRFSRVASLLTAILPVATMVWFFVEAHEQVTSVLGEVPSEMTEVRDLIGNGVWLYAAASLVLLGVSVLYRGRR